VRRGSATVVALVGEVSEQLVAELARSANVTVASAPREEGLDAAAGVLREAAGRASPFVVVAADPLAEMAERVRHALRSLPQGPWWPSLDHLVDAARSFFPGALSAPGSTA
jgi:hypothetical protein